MGFSLSKTLKGGKFREKSKKLLALGGVGIHETQREIDRKSEKRKAEELEQRTKLQDREQIERLKLAESKDVIARRTERSKRLGRRSLFAGGGAGARLTPEVEVVEAEPQTRSTLSAEESRRRDLIEGQKARRRGANQSLFSRF